jgi:hypothetical protein
MAVESNIESLMVDLEIVILDQTIAEADVYMLLVGHKQFRRF